MGKPQESLFAVALVELLEGYAHGSFAGLGNTARFTDG